MQEKGGVHGGPDLVDSEALLAYVRWTSDFIYENKL